MRKRDKVPMLGKVVAKENGFVVQETLGVDATGRLVVLGYAVISPSGDFVFESVELARAISKMKKLARNQDAAPTLSL